MSSCLCFSPRAPWHRILLLSLFQCIRLVLKGFQIGEGNDGGDWCKSGGKQREGNAKQREAKQSNAHTTRSNAHATRSNAGVPTLIGRELETNRSVARTRPSLRPPRARGTVKHFTMVLTRFSDYDKDTGEVNLVSVDTGEVDRLCKTPGYKYSPIPTKATPKHFRSWLLASPVSLERREPQPLP